MYLHTICIIHKYKLSRGKVKRTEKGVERNKKLHTFKSKLQNKLSSLLLLFIYIQCNLHSKH